MAKTTKPVSLLIHPSLDGPEMEKLREQGHTIDVMWEEDTLGSMGPLNYNMILGPNCWWLPPEHIDLLSSVLKAIRETRYPPTAKKPTKRKKNASYCASNQRLRR